MLLKKNRKTYIFNSSFIIKIIYIFIFTCSYYILKKIEIFYKFLIVIFIIKIIYNYIYLDLKLSYLKQIIKLIYLIIIS